MIEEMSCHWFLQHRFMGVRGRRGHRLKSLWLFWLLHCLVLCFVMLLWLAIYWVGLGQHLVGLQRGENLHLEQYPQLTKNIYLDKP